MSGRIYKMLYQLLAHRSGAWSLLRWIVTLIWGAALVIVLQWLLRGRSPVSLLHWLVLGLMALMGLAFLLAAWRARRRSFVAFTAEQDILAPQGAALDPTDKVLIRATGAFEVSGKTHLFADLLAYWRTYASREHAVMAIVHDTRYLLIGGMPEENLGMWYIFFKPETIQAITPGRLAFGAVDAPALRLAYMHTPHAPQDRKRRRPPKSVRRDMYLSFGDEEDRRRIWADLLADGG